MNKKELARLALRERRAGRDPKRILAAAVERLSEGVGPGGESRLLNPVSQELILWRDLLEQSGLANDIVGIFMRDYGSTEEVAMNTVRSEANSAMNPPLRLLAERNKAVSDVFTFVNRLVPGRLSMDHVRAAIEAVAGPPDAGVTLAPYINSRQNENRPGPFRNIPTGKGDFIGHISGQDGREYRW